MSPKAEQQLIKSVNFLVRRAKKEDEAKTKTFLSQAETMERLNCKCTKTLQRYRDGYVTRKGAKIPAKFFEGEVRRLGRSISYLQEAVERILNEAGNNVFKN